MAIVAAVSFHDYNQMQFYLAVNTEILRLVAQEHVILHQMGSGSNFKMTPLDANFANYNCVLHSVPPICWQDKINL